MSNVWVDHNWPVGQVADFRIDAVSQGPVQRAGTRAVEPRLWKDGVPFRPSGVVIHSSMGRADTVTIQFGRDTEIIVSILGEAAVSSSDRSVDSLIFHGRVQSVTIDGVLPLPEEGVRWDRPERAPALTYEDFADVRKALNR